METLIKKKQAEELKFEEMDVLKVLMEGMSALNTMELLSFIHRDIKSANILVTSDGKNKIGDFNSSKVIEGTIGSSTVAGSLEYTAPEIVNSERCTFAVDVFSLGAVLYEMMVGRTPFVNERGLVLRNLSLGKYTPIPANLGYSAELVNLVHSCLRLDPAGRPTAAAVLSSALASRTRTAELARELGRVQERLTRAEADAVELRAESG